MTRLRGLALKALHILGWVSTGLILLWGIPALWFCGPVSSALRLFLIALVACSLLVVRIWLRPLYASIATNLIIVSLVTWWATISPSNDRDWMPEVARTPTAEVQGNRITLHNLRNFDYRSETDFDIRWEDRVYDLNELVGADLFMSYWGSDAIAHTILSWEFANHNFLAVSIEVRKEKGEEYSALRSFFRCYELCYVAADERDLIRLRTNYRGEKVYRYRFFTSLESARAMLLDYCKEMNELAQKPRFYNALTTNCTTVIRAHALRISDKPNPWTWKVLLNGYLDESLYERGVIDTSLPFSELKKKSFINPAAIAADHDPKFSELIRLSR